MVRDIGVTRAQAWLTYLIVRGGGGRRFFGDEDGKRDSSRSRERIKCQTPSANVAIQRTKRMATQVLYFPSARIIISTLSMAVSEPVPPAE